MVALLTYSRKCAPCMLPKGLSNQTVCRLPQAAVVREGRWEGGGERKEEE